MIMRVANKRITIGDIKISGVGSSSVVLVGDTKLITSSSYFDTPKDSLLFGQEIPVADRQKSEGSTTLLN